MNEKYIGDGLYVRYDGFAIWLRAPRTGGDHEVALEPNVFNALLRWSWNQTDKHPRRVLEKFTRDVADGGDA